MFTRIVGDKQLITIQKAIRNPKKAIRVLIHRMRGVTGQTDFKRFIILTRSRTGSNLLVSFLNSHPNIYAEEEIVNRLHGRDYRKILSTVFGKQPGEIKAKGFKIFYYHPLDDNTGMIWDDLAAMDDLLVIHLKRRNILRTLISRKIAEMQDVWRMTSGPGDQASDRKTVSFTVEELDEGFNRTREMEKDGERRFASHSSLTVYYEDMVADPNRIFRDITKFLGVPNFQPQTSLRKQNPERLSTLVDNYQDLKEAFSKTTWDEFFDE